MVLGSVAEDLSYMQNRKPVASNMFMSALFVPLEKDDSRM